VIGGNGNSVAILRRRSPLIFDDKQYVSVGLLYIPGFLSSFVRKKNN
jgi:hypothetical protein